MLLDDGLLRLEGLGDALDLRCLQGRRRLEPLPQRRVLNTKGHDWYGALLSLLREKDRAAVAYAEVHHRLAHLDEYLLEAKAGAGSAQHFCQRLRPPPLLSLPLKEPCVLNDDRRLPGDGGYRLDLLLREPHG